MDTVRDSQSVQGKLDSSLEGADRHEGYCLMLLALCPRAMSAFKPASVRFWAPEVRPKLGPRSATAALS